MKGFEVRPNNASGTNPDLYAAKNSVLLMERFGVATREAIRQASAKLKRIIAGPEVQFGFASEEMSDTFNFFGRRSLWFLRFTVVKLQRIRSAYENENPFIYIAVDARRQFASQKVKLSKQNMNKKHYFVNMFLFVFTLPIYYFLLLAKQRG